MANIPENKKKEMIGLRINPTLHEYITSKADNLRMTKSAYIEYLLMDKMITEQGDKPIVR